ncbi:HET-domain-containing protein, partial [Lojkania enalia]
MIGKGYDISPYGISETCINLARQWLYECTNCLGKHAKCQLIKPAQLPTRVIDVEEMRLYATIPGDAGQYVALSHCWGGSHPVRTTIDNLESHMVRLPESLPQTFADAIAVTKALSLRYLWIDSLCIVQDSKEDWSSESAHMAKVYENAFVTISADGAKDSFEGFLSAPSRSIRPAKVIQYSYVDGAGSETSRNVFVRQRGKLGLMLPYHDFPKELSIPARNQRRQDVQHITRRTEMEEAPSSRLSTRGWVFQERFLSPRTLHFATSELGWECRSICTCECSTTSFRPVRKTSLLKYWLSDFRPDTNHTYWRTELVREYSRLDLTVPSDRLVAFSGLAEAVSRLRPGDAYLAGLWKNTLRWDLLWCVQDKRESKRLGNLVAPSWSWASVDGPVVYPLSRRGSKLKWVSQRFTIEQIDL